MSLQSNQSFRRGQLQKLLSERKLLTAQIQTEQIVYQLKVLDEQIKILGGQYGK